MRRINDKTNRAKAAARLQSAYASFSLALPLEPPKNEFLREAWRQYVRGEAVELVKAATDALDRGHLNWSDFRHFVGEATKCE